MVELPNLGREFEVAIRPRKRVSGFRKTSLTAFGLCPDCRVPLVQREPEIRSLKCSGVCGRSGTPEYWDAIRAAHDSRK